MLSIRHFCDRASALASRGQEVPLTAGERVRLRLHLLICVHCTRFVRQIGILRRAGHGLPEHLDAD